VRRYAATSTTGTVALLMLAGCASTPYKSGGGSEGYSDFRITTDVFAVSFRGNVRTSEEVVDKFLLRRAAELTLKHGFQYFVILSEKERTRQSSVGYSGVKIPIIAPGTAIWIRCFSDPPADIELPIHAADFLRFNFPEALEDISVQDSGGEGP